MTQVVPLLTDDEVSRSAPLDEEAGFGALATSKGNLPLTAMDIQGRIAGLLAEISLRQTFVNALGEPLEATYIFPLPDRAAVTRFSLEVAGRVIEGVLQERGAEFIGPEEGMLSCGYEGLGRLWPVDQVAARALALLGGKRG